MYQYHQNFLKKGVGGQPLKPEIHKETVATPFGFTTREKAVPQKGLTERAAEIARKAARNSAPVDESILAKYCRSDEYLGSVERERRNFNRLENANKGGL